MDNSRNPEHFISEFIMDFNLGSDLTKIHHMAQPPHMTLAPIPLLSPEDFSIPLKKSQITSSQPIFSGGLVKTTLFSDFTMQVQLVKN